MAHKLTSQERQNRREHYAYRTNNFCVKNEEIKIIVGGWHDSHPVILDKIASGIYTSFLAVSKMIEESDAKVKTFHSKIYDDGESKKYRIHIFTRERTETKRKAMWINAGIYIKLKDKLGYTRIFRMPCKCKKLYKLLYLMESNFCTKISVFSNVTQVDGRSSNCRLMKSSLMIFY